MISFNLGHIIYLSAVYSYFGKQALIFHLVYSLFVTWLLEAVNYIEHYGLERKQDANGTYESVSIKHSWNAPQVVTNWLLFKLQRHSDHHANAYKPYQILQSLPMSPQLPYGYSASLVLSYIPPVWRYIVDPYAKATNNDQKLSPETKKKIDRMILAALCSFSVVITYICFFLIGFKSTP